MELLPSTARAYNFVHLLNLKPCKQDELEPKNEIVIDPEGNMELVVDQIISHAGCKENREYLAGLSEDADEDPVWMTKIRLSIAMDTVKNHEESIKTIKKTWIPT